MLHRTTAKTVIVQQSYSMLFVCSECHDGGSSWSELQVGSGLVSNSNTALVLNQILIETSPRCYMLCYSGYVMYILYYAYVILGYVGYVGLFIYAIRLSPLVDFATGVFTSQGH